MHMFFMCEGIHRMTALNGHFQATNMYTYLIKNTPDNEFVSRIYTMYMETKSIFCVKIIKH